MTTPAWEDAIAALSRRPEHTALFLDFDGTLAPIVDDPLSTCIEPSAIDLLKRLAAQLHTVAVVSGRPGAFLADRLALTPTTDSSLRAYGRGGLDIVDGRGTITSDGSFDSWLPPLQQLAADARRVAPAAWIEEKGVVVTMHWRRAPETEHQLRTFAYARAGEDGLLTREGKMSIECFPKGTATKQTVVAAGSVGCEAVAFFGDDIGDLDGFSALDQFGDDIATVRVCVRSHEAPQELIDRADLVLDGPPATLSFLEELAGAIERERR